MRDAGPVWDGSSSGTGSSRTPSSRWRPGGTPTPISAARSRCFTDMSKSRALGFLDYQDSAELVRRRLSAPAGGARGALRDGGRPWRPGHEVVGIETGRAVVHPWLCDSMGHLNTRHYAAMFDDASFHLLGALAGPAEGETLGRGWADVRHVHEFRREARAATLLVTRSAVTRIGTKSLTYRHAPCTTPRPARCWRRARW